MEVGLTRDGDGDGVGNLVGTEDEAGGNDITGRGTALCQSQYIEGEV
jgi:hypothetical protein